MGYPKPYYSPGKEVHNSRSNDLAHSINGGEIEIPTHGSLTKAGKVRAQTPKVDKTVTRGSPSPARRNFRNFSSRVTYQPVDRKFRRRR